MAVFKCKMCGGSLNISEEDPVCTCEFCDTVQTVPRLDSESKVNLYDRADHFRRNNDYDKAMGIYEQILNEDDKDSEAYWSLILCRYGVEYVEDNVTKKRIPTINRTQYTSVYADENYKCALKYASVEQKAVYEKEALEIDRIQKGILAISEKEDPFDVFISYKDTDEGGRRTVDSVLANDLYHQLTQEGFKVFFSRITLEDKLGQEYEPYIFSALNSAKVMVVLGTKKEYLTSVWVKNEWIRFLSMIKAGVKKTLIPAYKDMDPYDLPEEFSHLQAQDMSKLGFMQDLIRGIKKITAEERKEMSTKETVIIKSGSTGNVEVLLKRGNMALEDEEWEQANLFFEDALNQNPECAEGYLGKYLAKRKCENLEALKEYYRRSLENVAEEKIYACPKNTQRIEEAIKKYCDDDTIPKKEAQALFEFDLSFLSECPDLQKKKTQFLDETSEDKLYKRIIQYASEELRESLNKINKEIIAAFDCRIGESQKKDDVMISNLKKEYAEFLENVEMKLIDMQRKEKMMTLIVYEIIIGMVVLIVLLALIFNL